MKGCCPFLLLGSLCYWRSKALRQALNCCAKALLISRIRAGGASITQSVLGSPGSSEMSGKCQLSPPSPALASPEFQLQENFCWVWDSVRQCLKQSMVHCSHLPKPVLNRSDLQFLILNFLGRTHPFPGSVLIFFSFFLVLFCFLRNLESEVEI